MQVQSMTNYGQSQQSGTSVADISMASLDESVASTTNVVLSKKQSAYASVNVTSPMLGHTDVVQEEEEKESDEASQ